MYAHGMDALQRDTPQSMDNPDALYAAILALPTFDGLAGPVTLGADGDRFGDYLCAHCENLALRKWMPFTGTYFTTPIKQFSKPEEESECVLTPKCSAAAAGNPP